MAYIIELPLYADQRGNLTVIEKIVPFDIKRVYWMYDVTQSRGGHRHKETVQALICLKGKCEVYINNGKNQDTFTLNSPDKCLIVEAADWHTLNHFSSDAILLVLASHYFDKEDYIHTDYTTLDTSKVT